MVFQLNINARNARRGPAEHYEPEHDMHEHYRRGKGAGLFMIGVHIGQYGRRGKGD